MSRDKKEDFFETDQVGTLIPNKKETDNESEKEVLLSNFLSKKITLELSGGVNHRISFTGNE